MALNIRPLGERVVVKPLEAETKTASGIYIPDSAKEKPITAEVVAINSSLEKELKVGEKVLYSKYAGTKVEIEGTEYLILEMKEILAVL
jgi:chaperonin GroES